MKVSRKTKVQRVREELERGRWVGPLQAFQLCGTLRFSGIVYVLRHEQGMDLEHRDVENQHGVRWREFRLRPQAGPGRLF